jgi:hypothetical protein
LNKKKLLKIWGEKSRKTLKKRIISMKALRNHQFRPPNLWNNYILIKLDDDKNFVDQD